MKYLTASATNVGLKRKVNEDSLLDQADLAVWAVADGMGGHEAGEVASALLVKLLAKLPEDGSLADASEAAERLIQEANSELLMIAQASPQPRTIGSTIVALAIRHWQFVCLWAGDSRCYLVRDRQITQLTSDHSLVDELIRSGMLTREEAATHPDANVITRAVGAKRELKVDSVDGSVRPGDLFFLASDGVTRVMSDDEICRVISTQNPAQAVKEIESTVLQRGAPDNLTCIIVRVL